MAQTTEHKVTATVVARGLSNARLEKALDAFRAEVGADRFRRGKAAPMKTAGGHDTRSTRRHLDFVDVAALPANAITDLLAAGTNTRLPPPGRPNTRLPGWTLTATGSSAHRASDPSTLATPDLVDRIAALIDGWCRDGHL
jgi:hypothetical protein